MPAFASVSLALLTAAVSVAAQPHADHHHAHLHKRDATEVAWIPPTVIAYVLNGQPNSEEVNQGIANGTVVRSSGGVEPALAASSLSTASPSPRSTIATQESSVFTSFSESNGRKGDGSASSSPFG